MLSNVRHHSISIFLTYDFYKYIKINRYTRAWSLILALYLISLKVTQFEIKYFL